MSEFPSINGLVMAGGDSRRMGSDKAMINYHGMPQQEYIANLLSSFCSQVFISKRKGQPHTGNSQVLEDAYADIGPFGGILSAFAYAPENAWFVVACDFPLVNEEGLRQLVEARNPSAYATGFLDERSLMPEPWITILEPKIYPVLLDYYKKGRSSLRGILVDYNSTTIRVKDKDILLNANTPEESDRLKQIIHSQKKS